MLVEYINQDFVIISEDDLSLIFNIQTNYINASKICKMFNKKLIDWKKENKKELEEFQKEIDNLFITIGRDNPLKVRGVYIHPLLFNKLSNWISIKTYITCSKIINKYESIKEKIPEDNTINLLKKISNHEIKVDKKFSDLCSKNELYIQRICNMEKRINNIEEILEKVLNSIEKMDKKVDDHREFIEEEVIRVVNLSRY